MKRNLWLLLLLCSTTAYAQKNSFEIKGKMTGWKGKEQVMLSYTVDAEHVMDTVEADNGTFQFSGTVTEPRQVTLVRILSTGKGARDTRNLFIDGGTVSVAGTDSLKRSRITGSRLTNENEELHAAFNPLIERFVYVKLKAIGYSKADQEKPEFKALVKEHDSLIKAMQEVYVSFIRKYPSSYISLATVNSMAGATINYNKIAPVYNLLSPKLKALPLGIRLGKAIEIAKKTNIGVIMPDFTSLDTLRKPLNLYHVVQKGKVTLVDFWASWCKPCRQENPNVVKAFNAFHEKGFNILSVSLDQNEASWKKAIRTDGMPWYHVSGLKYWDEPVAKEFGINGVP